MSDPQLLNHFSPGGAGRVEHVLGTSMIYKAEPAQTGGAALCVEITVPPGVGVPPHRHRDEDEAFYVLSGKVAIEGDGCAQGGTVLGQGGFFFGPRGQMHGFRGVGEAAARLLVFVTPGTGMAAMFAGLAEMGSAGGAVDPAAVGAWCSRHGIEFART